MSKKRDVSLDGMKEQAQQLIERIKRKTGKTQQEIATELGYKWNYISEMLGPNGVVSVKFIDKLKLRFSEFLEPESPSRGTVKDPHLPIFVSHDTASAQLMQQLLDEKEARRQDAEGQIKKYEDLYQEAKKEKDRLFSIVESLQRTIDTNLNVIQTNLTTTQGQLETVLSSVRSGHSAMMDALDSLLKRKPGTLQREAGIVELAVRQVQKKKGRTEKTSK